MNIREMLALSGVPEIGPTRFRNLVAFFGSPENVFKASIQELQKVDGISEKIAQNIKCFEKYKFANTQLKILEKTKSKIITYWEENYPENLKNIYDPPIFIFVKGDIIPQDKFAISIVGARKPSTYGKIYASKLSEELAEKGFTIISGMAHGIDSIAHKGALKAKGRTIAVLGSGLDVIYPKENKELYQKITENGAVISEFFFRTNPDPGNFPRRNRIISGLGLGVVVVEAGAKSGALITAKLALEQNREVFAVPGNLESPKSAGTNALIKESGAKLIQSVDDILSEIKPQIEGFKKKEMIAKEVINISEDERKIFDILSEIPTYIDKIAENACVSTQFALSVLLALELKGLVKQLQGKQFIRLQEI
jgi:DNA processing protein